MWLNSIIGCVLCFLLACTFPALTYACFGSMRKTRIHGTATGTCDVEKEVALYNGLYRRWVVTQQDAFSTAMMAILSPRETMLETCLLRATSHMSTSAHPNCFADTTYLEAHVCVCVCVRARDARNCGLYAHVLFQQWVLAHVELQRVVGAKAHLRRT